MELRSCFWAPEQYFDPVLTHRRRTYVELVRLLARRGTVRFTLEKGLAEAHRRCSEEQFAAAHLSELGASLE